MQKSDDNKKRRLILNWALRFSVSGVVLGIVFWLLPMDEFWSAIKSISLSLWALILILFLAGHVVAAIKWWLLTTLDADIPFSRALKAHFAGLVANLSLPGVAGGDVVRAGLVFRHSKNKTRVTIGSLADRLLDSTVLLILAFGGMLVLLHDHWEVDGRFIGGLGLAFGIFLVITVILLPRILHKLPMQHTVEKVVSVMREFSEQPGKLVLCTGISILVQVLFIGLSLALAIAIGVKVPVAAWIFAWPLAKVLAIAPISISGLGIREGGLAALLTPFGANPATVVAAGLLWQSILFAGGLIGGLALIMASRLQRAVIKSGSKINPQDSQNPIAPSSHQADQHSP